MNSCGVKPHRPPAARAVDAVVLPAERDAGVVGCNEAAVRDGDTMRVTGEIAQHLLGSCERRQGSGRPAVTQSGCCVYVAGQCVASSPFC